MVVRKLSVTSNSGAAQQKPHLGRDWLIADLRGPSSRDFSFPRVASGLLNFSRGTSGTFLAYAPNPAYLKMLRQQPDEGLLTRVRFFTEFLDQDVRTTVLIACFELYLRALAV